MKKMIKKALLLSVAALGLFSCNSDDDTTKQVNEASIVGKWQAAKYIVYSGKDGSAIPGSSSDANPCDKKGSLDISSTGKWHEIIYSENTEGQCTLDSDNISDYTYDSVSKKVQVKYPNGTTRVYPVKKITDTELEFVEDSYDINSDGINDMYTFVFKRL